MAGSNGSCQVKPPVQSELEWLLRHGDRHITLSQRRYLAAPPVWGRSIEIAGVRSRPNPRGASHFNGMRSSNSLSGRVAASLGGASGRTRYDEGPCGPRRRKKRNGSWSAIEGGQPSAPWGEAARQALAEQLSGLGAPPGDCPTGLGL